MNRGVVMKVELITCPDSPQCRSAKMYLDMRGVNYEHVEVSHKEMKEREFDEMPILIVDDEVEMMGFDPSKLSKLF